MTYDELRIFYDPKSLVDQCGIKYQDRTTFLSMKCPYHEDKSPSGALYLDTGVFKCFAGSCGVVKSFRQFLVDHGVPWPSSDEDTSKLDDKLLTKMACQRTVVAKSEKVAAPDQDASLVPAWSSDTCREMLQKRKALEDFASYFDLMYAPPHTEVMGTSMGNRLIVPLRNSSNETYCYEGRRVSTTQQPKVLYPKGALARQHILHHDNLSQAGLALVEGFMDLIPLWNKGYRSISTTFGSKVTREQLKEINTFDTLELFCDGDEAGIVWAETILSHYLMDHSLESVALYYKKGFDASQLEEEGRFDALLRSSFSVQDFRDLISDCIAKIKEEKE